MVSLKYLLFLLVIVILCYIKSDDSQKGIEIMYQQNLLLAEKFDNIDQVPFPGFDTKIHQQLKTLSLLFNNSCHQYEFGCDLKLMKTKESDLTFTNLIEHVEKHLLAAQNDVEDIKDQIYKTA